MIQGNDGDVANFVPDYLKQLLRISDTCVEKVEEVKKKFEDVIDLIAEIMEACAAAKGDYEEQKHLAVLQKVAIEKREKMLKEEMKQADANYKLMKDQCDQSVKKYEKAMDSDSSMAAKRLANTAESAIQAASSIPMMLSNASPIGFVSAALSSASAYLQSNSHQASSSSSQSDGKNEEMQVKKELTREDRSLSTQLPSLRENVNYLKQQADLLCDGEKESVDGNVLDNSIAIVVESEAFLKDYKGRQRQRLQNLKKDSVELAKILQSEIKQMRSDLDENRVKDLQHKIEASLSGMEMYFADSGTTSALQRAPNLYINAKNKKSAVEQQSENFQRKLGIAQQTLEGARLDFRYANDRIQGANEKMAQVIADLAKTKIDEIDFDQIKEILRKSLNALGEVKEQWGKLIRFFQTVSALIKCSMHENISKFIEDSKIVEKEALDYDLSHLHRDLLCTNAISAKNLALVIHNMSSMYMDLSNKHIMDRLASLGKLMALDPEKDRQEIIRIQKQLNSDSLAACNVIKEIVQGRKDEFENRISKTLNKIDDELKKLPDRPKKHPLVEAEEKKAIEEAREDRHAQPKVGDYM